MAGLHQAQDVLGVVQVEPGDALLFAQRQYLQVAVGDAGEQGQLYRCAVVLAGLEAFQGTAVGSPATAPEVHFVAGAEAGGEGVDGIVVGGRVGTAVARVAQEFLPAGAERRIQLRQQRRAGDHRRGLGLAHAGHRCAEVLAVQQGALQQAVQFRRAEGLPPLADVAGIAAPGRQVAPLRGAARPLSRGAGSAAAGAEQQAGGNQERFFMDISVIGWPGRPPGPAGRPCAPA